MTTAIDRNDLEIEEQQEKPQSMEGTDTEQSQNDSHREDHIPQVRQEQTPVDNNQTKNDKNKGQGCEFFSIRSRRDVYWLLVLIALIIGVIASGVLVHIKLSNPANMDEPEYDPITGKAYSAYRVPTRPDETIITDEDELNLILDAVQRNTILLNLTQSIPSTVAALRDVDVSSSDPYIAAASWLINTDTVNAMEYAVTRYALAVIYYTDGGDNWTNKTNWMSSEYHCNWHGVVCCDNSVGSTMCKSGDFGRVIEIDLFRNNLIGTISSSFVLFPSLQSLYLSENELTGTIPGVALGSLKNFSKLWASYNSLSGTIPSELDNNGIFNTLYVQGNNLSGTFPSNYCSCAFCKQKLVHFGIDCGKVECSQDCCERVSNCFTTLKTSIN